MNTITVENQLLAFEYKGLFNRCDLSFQIQYMARAICTFVFGHKETEYYSKLRNEMTFVNIGTVLGWERQYIDLFHSTYLGNSRTRALIIIVISVHNNLIKPMCFYIRLWNPLLSIFPVRTELVYPPYVVISLQFWIMTAKIECFWRYWFFLVKYSNETKSKEDVQVPKRLFSPKHIFNKTKIAL